MGEREEPIDHIEPTSSRRQLYEYFSKKLPPDLPEDILKKLSCLGFARLVLEELGGVDNARIYWVLETDKGDSVNHAFVVKTDAQPTDLAYNNYLDPWMNVEEVKKFGKDITQVVIRGSWRWM